MEEQLREAATAVRRAIESAVGFAGFPHNYCNGASDVLGLYFINNLKIGPVEIVAGGLRRHPELDEFGKQKEQSHLWLEVEDYIVDITADQFNDCDQAVIVTKDRSWHDQFKGQKRFPHEDILKCAPYNKEVYYRVVQRIAEVQAMTKSQ